MLTNVTGRKEFAWTAIKTLLVATNAIKQAGGNYAFGYDTNVIGIDPNRSYGSLDDLVDAVYTALHGQYQKAAA